MIETVFRTDDVPMADRFDYWRECMTKMMCPTEMGSEFEGEFRAQSRHIELGPLSIWPAEMRPLSWRRTPSLIRLSDPELYHLSLPLRGSIAISQGSADAVHGVSEMYIVDTSLPFHCLVPDTTLAGVGFEIPKALVPLPPDKVRRLLTRRLPAGDGFGALLAGFLRRLADDTGSYGPADEERLQGILVDLFTATLAHHLEADDTLSPEAHRRTLLLSIQAFIRRHLHDPDLSPDGIALAHNISTSHLHRLFATQDLTVSAWIRRERLERARRDLADHRQYAVPVHRIAARWGFRYHAVFSRAFCEAYGLPPRDYRHARLTSEV